MSVHLSDWAHYKANMTALNDSKKGVLLAFFGVLILSPDSLLVRLIDVPFYTLMFWRGFFMFLSLALFLLVDTKKDFMHLWLDLNKPTFFVSILFVISTFLFVSSLLHTSVAHTLLIVGTSPIFSALFSIVILKEKPQWRVWAGMVTILFALTMVVQQNEQLVTLEGDMYAFLSAIIMGYIFVHVRHHNETHLILALSLSGLWTALVSMLLVTELQVDWVNGSLLLLLGTLVGIAFSLITLSARHIPAPITGLFMPLETVFGVFLVWLFIGEQPSQITIAGGVIIIFVLMMISYFELKQP